MYKLYNIYQVYFFFILVNVLPALDYFILSFDNLHYKMCMQNNYKIVGEFLFHANLKALDGI